MTLTVFDMMEALRCHAQRQQQEIGHSIGED